MFWEQPVQYASRSDVGLRRDNNEDSCVVRLALDEETYAGHGHLFVVADGMGGHAVGELASKLAVETVPLAFFKSQDVQPEVALRTALEEANRVIHDRGDANTDFRRMGTTCSALLLAPSGAHVAHVGDSRVYRVRHHRIDQLSFDHSLEWELRRQGRRLPGPAGNEPRNVITRSLGPEVTVLVDLEGPYPVLGGDAFVLCSDGLTTHVVDEEIGAAVRHLPAEDACRLLVDLALLRGGADNVTVIVLRVGSPPANSSADTKTLPSTRSPISWSEFAALVLAVAFVAAGILGATYFEQWDAGAALAVLGVALGVVVLLLNWRRRERVAQTSAGDGHETMIWRPHASASAQLTRRFVEGLATLDAELARTARDEAWTIDWAGHSESAELARSALDEKRYTDAFAACARSVHHLVDGIVDRRKRLKHQARWGKSAAAE